MKNITKDIRISVVALLVAMLFAIGLIVSAGGYEEYPIDNDTPTTNIQLNNNQEIAPPATTPSTNVENQGTENEILGDIIIDTDGNSEETEISNGEANDEDTVVPDVDTETDDNNEQTVVVPENNESKDDEVSDNDATNDVVEDEETKNESVDEKNEGDNAVADEKENDAVIKEEPETETIPPVNTPAPPVEEPPVTEEVEAPVIEYLQPSGEFAHIDYSIYSAEQKALIQIILDKINANVNSDIKEEEFVVEQYVSLEDYYSITSFFYVYYGQKDAVDNTFDFISTSMNGQRCYKIRMRYDNIRRFESELQTVHNKIDEVLSTFTAGDEKHILRQISDYLMNNMVYTNGYYDVHSAILEGKGVCNAYALAFNMMANRAGIKSDMCIGKSISGEYHAWNRVTLSNGEYRYYDITWYDGNSHNTKYLHSKTSFHGDFLINDYVNCWFKK